MITVDWLRPTQHESLVQLLLALNHFYEDDSASPEQIREHLSQRLLAQGNPLKLIVATDSSEQVVGFAAVAVLHSLVSPNAPQHTQLLLKELFVLEPFRARGIGRQLMAWIARYAEHQGCGRIDWNVRADNAKGITFYESLGGRKVQERLSYRMSSTALAQLANQSLSIDRPD